MMIQVMIWWLVLGAIVVFGAGALFGMIMMACCAAAGCTDCRLAAKPAITTIYRCRLLQTEGVCNKVHGGKSAGIWCELCPYLDKATV